MSNFVDSLCGPYAAVDTGKQSSLPLKVLQNEHKAVTLAKQMQNPEKEQSLSASFMNFSESPKAIVWSVGLITVYLGLGTTIFALWIDEWNAVDAIYFTVATFTTVGYGDLFPMTMGQRIFGMFFILFGIMIIGGVAFGILTDAAFKILKNKKEKAVHNFITRFEDDGDSVDERLIVETFGRIATFVFIIAVIFVPGIVIGHFEGWKFYESIYYSIVTATTVGYGDLSPKLIGTRILACFYLPLCVTMMATLFAKVTSIYMDKKAEQEEAGFLNRSLTREDIAKMDIHGDGKVDSEEFLVFMLLAMDKVDREIIDKIYKTFDKLDTDNSKTLELSDIANALFSSDQNHEKSMV